jgi:peroxiredoxin
LLDTSEDLSSPTEGSKFNLKFHSTFNAETLLHFLIDPKQQRCCYTTAVTIVSMEKQQQRSTISVGTDMIASSTDGVSLQNARPWYNSDAEGSNLASDNAVSLDELFRNKSVVVFGVPAPFTGTCTLAHYPPYKKLADEFKSVGVDEIVCYSVTDPYAHYHWAEKMGNDPANIRFLADSPYCSFAKTFGLDAEYDTEYSLGLRSERFSMFVVNGIVRAFSMVPEHDASKDAETMLQKVKEWKESNNTASK